MPRKVGKHFKSLLLSTWHGLRRLCRHSKKHYTSEHTVAWNLSWDVSGSFQALHTVVACTQQGGCCVRRTKPAVKGAATQASPCLKGHHRFDPAFLGETAHLDTCDCCHIALDSYIQLCLRHWLIVSCVFCIMLWCLVSWFALWIYGFSLILDSI